MVERVLNDPLRAGPVLRGLAVFVAAGVALYLGGLLIVGRASVASSLSKIGVSAMLAAALLASLTYLVRFARWHWSLLFLGYGVPLRRNLAVYVAGLALTTSPGKLGETLRSALLVPWHVPVSASLATFLADRLSDVVGVAILWWLASLGSNGKASVAAILVVMGVFAGFLLRGATLGAFRRRWPDAFHSAWWWRAALLIVSVSEHWRTLWTPLRVLFFTGAAIVAYGLQALAFVGLCMHVGVTLSIARLTEIFASSTLVGAASLVPGGLGAMELTLVLQLRSAGVDDGLALALAMATRLVTLWFGVMLGVFALADCVRFGRPRQFESKIENQIER